MRLGRSIGALLLQTALNVFHVGVIKSFRALIERVRSTEYRSHDKIHNCQIVWYTRRDPKTGYISSKYNWVKSLCPWDLHLSRYTNEWKEIRRHVYSNVELLRSVGQVVQLVNWPLNAGNVSSESSTAPGNAWPYGIVGYTDSSDSDEGFSNIRQPSNCQPILKAGYVVFYLLVLPLTVLCVILSVVQEFGRCKF